MYGSKEWHYEMRGHPMCGAVTASSIENPLSLQEFLLCCPIYDPHAGRPQVHTRMRQAWGSCFSFARAEACRSSTRLAVPSTLADGAKVGAVILNPEDGTYQVIKLVYFEQDKDKGSYEDRIWQGLCALRPGPWAVRKAFLSFPERLPGYHVQ